MSARNLASLRHPPEVVVAFVRRLIDTHCTHQGTERRSFTRTPILLPIYVQSLDENFQPTGDVFAAVTKDISTGGIGLMHSKPVTGRYLQIIFSNDSDEEMTLAAQVRHCTPSGQYYHIGARFVVDWRRWRSGIQSDSH